MYSPNMAENPIKTVVIDNFTGRLTRLNYGDANSGYSRYQSTFGNDPFTNPSNLQWFEEPTRIDPTGSVITDLIMAAKSRLEAGITYVYAVGSLGRVYKIQVNDPTTYNPNYDNAVLLTTLTVNSPTFKYGASIQFYGATQKIYIGHDKGATSINFDGTSEAFVGDIAQWIQNVPRPSVNFTGITYWGNGTNIAAIDSTATVTTYAKLSPALPVGTQIRDIDVSPDGNYVQIVSSGIPQPDMTVSTQDTSSLSSSDSYFSYWNGTDTAITSYNPFLSYSINAHLSFGANEFTMGYDLGGAAIYQGSEKIISLPNSVCPTPQGLYAIGNLLGFGAPEYADGVLSASLITYGQYDNEVPKGLFRFFRQASAGLTSAGPFLPTSGTTVAGVGNTAWTSPGNITLDDSSYASISDSFGGASVVDNVVSLVKADGSIGTTNKASAIVWDTTDTIATYGGQTDLWGETWSPADINNANFGAVLSAKVGSVVIGNYLKGSGFGFAIPVTATILGIQLQIGRKRVAGGFSTEADVNYFKITVYASDTTAGQNVIQMPMCTVVSNLFYGASNSGYANNQVGAAKLYFSTAEASSLGTLYKLYKFTTVPTGLSPAIGGVYETQTQLFGKKVKLSEVRIYVEPLVLQNSFKLELMGSDGNVIPGSTQTFTAQNTDASAPGYVGNDYLWFTPQSPPTWGIGVRITNLGTANMTFVKVEYDYTIGGK